MRKAQAFCFFKELNYTAEQVEEVHYTRRAKAFVLPSVFQDSHNAVTRCHILGTIRFYFTYIAPLLAGSKLKYQSTFLINFSKVAKSNGN